MNSYKIKVGGPNDCPPATTTISNNPPISQEYGWICPKCGRVYSPSTTMCLYCGDNSNIMSTSSKREWWRDYCTITSDKLLKQELPTIDTDTFCVHYDQLPYYTTITAWS